MEPLGYHGDDPKADFVLNTASEPRRCIVTGPNFGTSRHLSKLSNGRDVGVWTSEGRLSITSGWNRRQVHEATLVSDHVTENPVL